MAFDFSKIDKTVDLKGLQADVEEAKKNNSGDFPTIPAGKYEVRVETSTDLTLEMSNLFPMSLSV